MGPIGPAGPPGKSGERGKPGIPGQRGLPGRVLRSCKCERNVPTQMFFMNSGFWISHKHMLGFQNVPSAMGEFHMRVVDPVTYILHVGGWLLLPQVAQVRQWHLSNHILNIDLLWLNLITYRCHSMLTPIFLACKNKKQKKKNVYTGFSCFWTRYSLIDSSHLIFELGTKISLSGIQRTRKRTIMQNCVYLRKRGLDKC